MTQPKDSGLLTRLEEETVGQVNSFGTSSSQRCRGCWRMRPHCTRTVVRARGHRSGAAIATVSGLGRSRAFSRPHLSICLFREKAPLPHRAV